MTDAEQVEWPSEITEADPGIITIRMSDVIRESGKAAAQLIDQLGITDSQTKFDLFESILYFSDPLRIIAAQQSQDCDCGECNPGK